MYYSTTSSCRLCKGKNLKTVIDLGAQYIQHAFIHPKKKSPLYRKFPTYLVRCANPSCGLVQLKHTVNRAILYSIYWYRSGTNNTMISHLKGIVKEVINITPVKKPTVLDIGCNDGTMLNMFPPTCTAYGIDPSDIALDAEKKKKIIHDFFPSPKLKNKTYDVITTIAMYYDIDNPVTFAREVKKILSKKGVWIVEVAYLPTTLANNSYDTICHEHLSYFHLGTLELIAQKAGLKIVKADLNNINGGSIRCYLTHASSTLYDSLDSDLEKIRSHEHTLKINEAAIFKSFVKRVITNRNKLVQLLQKLTTEGKHIHVYGASTKGNTILQYCGIDNTFIDAAADKNKEKWGGMTPGSQISIISEEESRKMHPDYYLVLPWSFGEEFIKREQKLLKKGTKMIFPLPKLKIVSL